MEDLLAEGRTLFLVSHSEHDLKRFGARGLYLRAGELVMDGPMDDVLARYNHDLAAGADRHQPGVPWSGVEGAAVILGRSPLAPWKT